ncbi:glutamine-hydrolyzing asparagine synthase [Dissoconium aciculare CBS 342.82]|uniref:asparagine synthase (glutamine-hydrolyzing) n=1 Tax=Dissoconium aciculare CBS 342.82 TaxID=1314786 RepID=A0A6J3LXP6_9PEZI|nr:glutamine-hydrolyzing asparagine synthase [Dissoconium aciculare CBS 342.82]KAF1820521.1 glutamine-hydrolyzing asparagine synthase [Dissoconium aciculare CBS 342.82]
MCGVFGCHRHPNVHQFRPTALRMARAIRHRGPDWTGTYTQNNSILVHERLAIIGIENGAQPLTNADQSVAAIVNGEIYNHRELRKSFEGLYEFQTNSDSEVIIPLYLKYGLHMAEHLDGIFSIILYDRNLDRLIAARDPIGVISLYQGLDTTSPDSVYFASELKSLHPVCDHIAPFPPGHMYDSLTGSMTQYYRPQWLSNADFVPTTPTDYKLLRSLLSKAVERQLMSEAPSGVLLSGGLDSSLIASIAQRMTSERGGERLHSFSIGLENAPDLAAAQKAAEYIGTKHHTFTFTVEEGLEAISDVIHHLETFDVTTIRASTPMYLLSRRIKALGIKMVLSGEGSDEMFGGYLYFHNAPDSHSFQLELSRRIQNLHLADCLRANKSTAAWGVEARVPFLDTNFLDAVMEIDPADKMIKPGRMEKYILRKAFDTSDEPDVKPFLPDSILWRQKEQFSDGVGYNWIDGIKDRAALVVTDEMMRNPKPEWKSDVPDTKEAYWFRCMFDEHFPEHCASTVARWTPTWSKETDPSGRVIGAHLDSTLASG